MIIILITKFNDFLTSIGNCNFIGGDISKTAIKISKERIDTFLRKKIDILEEKKIKK